MQQNSRPTLRGRSSLAYVCAAIAVLFALSGGAYAAGYLITSVHQISPRVLKELRGQRGPRGFAGRAASSSVATQTSCLLSPRLAACRPRAYPVSVVLLEAPQNGILRYSRLEVCVTGAVQASLM